MCLLERLARLTSRPGQKTILEAALGKISDRIEVVEELIGEGNGCACCM